MELNQVDVALAAGEARSAEPEASGAETAPNQRGGKAVVEKYGREYMAGLGKRGSNAVIRRYGLRFYSEIAARNRGVKKQRKQDQGPAE